MRAARRKRSVFWLWALLPLLLAAALTTPLLGHDGFNGDEPFSLFAAGLGSSAPWSLAAAWQFITAEDPQQAQGWPLLLTVWTRFVGWSEVAVRALSLFAGLLTLALVYRAGRDFFSPGAGLMATLLLSVSVFFHAYMLHARAFTLIALCATLCLWCYWRLALRPRPAGRGAGAGLFLGSSGLLWLHYINALLLPLLGLYHLLFVPKTRRWWRPVVPLALAALVAALQLPGLTAGLRRTTIDAELHRRAMSTPELLAQFLRYLSNDLLELSPLPDGLLLLAAAVLPAGVVAWQVRAGGRADSGRYLAIVAAALLTLMLALNEALRVIVPNRIRYLMPLWPLTALLAGAALWRLANRHRRLVTGLLAGWLILGSYLGLATDFRYEAGYFWRSDFHHVQPVLREQLAANDFLAVDYQAAKVDSGRMYLGLLGVPWVTIHRYRADPYAELVPDYAGHPFTWLLYRSRDRVGFTDLSDRLGLVLCERALDEWGFTLERYALHSVANCPERPERPVRLEFGAGIRLGAPQVRVADGTLRLDAHFYSEDEALLANYSLALHVIDLRSGERVAQGDTGVGPGHIVPLRSEIDVGALPAGEYALHVALYDWRNGERLPARDLETGARGDLLTLQRFRLD